MPTAWLPGCQHWGGELQAWNSLPPFLKQLPLGPSIHWWADREFRRKATAQCSPLSVFLTLQYRRLYTPENKSALRLSHHSAEREGEITYSPNFAQIASDTRRMISEPSKKTESQIFKTVWLGRHVAKRVRNHCIVKTFVSGGSYPPAIKQTLYISAELIMYKIRKDPFNLSCALKYWLGQKVHSGFPIPSYRKNQKNFFWPT